MTLNPHLSDPILDTGSFHFTCDINFDATRRDTGFQVTWLFDGKPDRNVSSVKLTNGVDRSTDLDQMSLKGHLGQDVRSVSYHYVSIRIQLHFPQYK